MITEIIFPKDPRSFSTEATKAKRNWNIKICGTKNLESVVERKNNVIRFREDSF